MFDDPFDDDNFDDDEPQQSDYPGFPYDINDKPGGELGEIFSDYGWSTWSDFLDDRYGQTLTDPESYRPGMYADITDAIFDLSDRGILDFSYVWVGEDGFVHYEVGGS